MTLLKFCNIFFSRFRTQIFIYLFKENLEFQASLIALYLYNLYLYHLSTHYAFESFALYTLYVVYKYIILAQPQMFDLDNGEYENSKICSKCGELHTFKTLKTTHIMMKTFKIMREKNFEAIRTNK